MALLDTVYWSDAQREAFENECFAQWLNKLDAIVDYENRRRICLAEWRCCFDLGDSVYEAAEWFAKWLKNPTW